jgi:hypothetical protein
VFERVQALRTIWTTDEPHFDGRWERFDASWVYPKPKQSPLPVGFGLSGEIGMRGAAVFADEWYPVDAALEQHGGVGAAIAKFRNLVTEAGRDPTRVPISLFVWGWAPGQPSKYLIASYSELEIERQGVGTAARDADDSHAVCSHIETPHELFGVASPVGDVASDLSAGAAIPRT